MIQDIQPHILKNEFHKRQPQDRDLLFIFQGDKPLLHQGMNTMEVPTVEMICNDFPEIKAEELLYLFEVDDLAVFTVLGKSVEVVEGQEYSYEHLNIFRTMQPSYLSFAGITASHLYKWYSRNQFCGRCGEKMTHKSDERAMVCPSCGFLDYPKICPVIIVGVTKGEDILLTKYANRSFTRYALIAGFCEIGESLERTIAREVMEEVGVKVKNIRYYNSQPWGFSESLLMGFFADLDGDDTITVDQNELKEAVWMNRHLIPDDEENELSLTYTMMQAFKNGENV